MIQNFGGLRIAVAGAALAPGVWSIEARRHFEAHHWCRVPRFLDEALLARVQRGIAAATFVEMRHEAVQPPSVDLAMVPNATAALLELCCNDPTVLRGVESLTGCGPLSAFGGFVYRLTPDAGLHHNWHSDCLGARQVAMSVNLDTAPYEGGFLELRDADSGEILGQAHNPIPGDALLFRIAPRLQHRVRPVTRGVKTAFAGWFLEAGSLMARLKAGQVDG